jgi:trigger factor
VLQRRRQGYNGRLSVWNRAKVAELVDALDLGSSAARCGGSSPPFRTIINNQTLFQHTTRQFTHLMQSAIEVISELERSVQISIPTSDINNETEKRLKKLSKTVKMAGFRPGKVPLSMVTKQYGPEVRMEVLQDSVGAAFGAAVESQSFRIAGNPNFEPVKDSAADQMAFIAKFEIYPEVKLPDVSGLSIERPIVTIGDEDIDRTLQTLQKQRVSYSPTDRAAEATDRIMIDFAGKIDGVAFQGGSAENFAMVVGEGRMLPEFEKAVVGLKAGESKSFNLTFPGDYPGAEVAGKTAEFTVTANAISEANFPPVDAEFAKQFGVASGDIAQLRSEVSQNLNLELKRRVFSNTRDQVLKGLRENTSLALPKVLVQNEAMRLTEEAYRDMQQRGMDGQGAELNPSMFEQQASDRVALGLIVSEMVKLHNLQATPEQVRAMLTEAASTYEQPEQVVAWYYQDPQRLGEFEALSLESNVVDWVIKNAKVSDKPQSFAQLMGQV